MVGDVVDSKTRICNMTVALRGLSFSLAVALQRPLLLANSSGEDEFCAVERRKVDVDVPRFQRFELAVDSQTTTMRSFFAAAPVSRTGL